MEPGVVAQTVQTARCTLTNPQILARRSARVRAAVEVEVEVVGWRWRWKGRWGWAWVGFGCVVYYSAQVLAQCCFTSTETIILWIIRGAGSPGRPPRLSHSSLSVRPFFSFFFFSFSLFLCFSFFFSLQQSGLL